MRSSRAGLTILELLLVLLGVMVLAGLLVVFLQNLQAKALQAQCAEHLKRQGEAVYHFIGLAPPAQPQALPKGAGHGFLPASCLDYTYATWAVQIAPGLTAKNPLEGWNLERPFAQQPQVVREALIAQFFCPARNRGFRLSQGEGPKGSLGDYACASGTGSPEHPWTSPRADGAIILAEVLESCEGKILRWRARTSLDSLERGVSVTILIGEKHVPWEQWGTSKTGDGPLYGSDEAADFARIGGPGFGLAPEPAAPFNSNFGSYHPGVCQFLMADGSVRALANSVSERVLGDLIRRK